MQLTELLEEVKDRESFFIFVRALVMDRKYAGNSGQRSTTNGLCLSDTEWQNETIEDYLEAALAWAESTSMGVSQGVPENPSWKAFAVFLYCGKIYE